MSVPLTITLNSIVGTPGPFNLYSDSDNYVTAFETGISLSSLQNGFGTSSAPNGTTNIKIKSTGAGCGYEIIKSISGLPTTPSPTPVPPTPTPTLTPTPTTYKYWLKMLRCDEDPTLLIYHYSKISFINNTIQRGDLFRGGSNGLGGNPPAGFYYYTVVDLLETDPNPITNGDVEGSKSFAPYALTCGEDPTHYVAATYRTAHINLFRYSGYTSYTQIQSGMCGKDPSQIIGGNGYSGTTGGWVDESTIQEGTTYQLYTTNIVGDNTKIVGPGSYVGILISGQGPIFAYVAYIDSTGFMTEVTSCTPAPQQSPTPTPTNTITPTTTPVFYWYKLTLCDDGVTIKYTPPLSGGADLAGKVWYSAGGYYYTIGAYTNTTNSYPGLPDQSDIVPGSISSYTSCADAGHTPPPSPPPQVGHSLRIYTGATYNNSNDACNAVVYQSDAGQYGFSAFLNNHYVPINGDFLYTDVYCTTEITSGNGNYYIAFSGATKYIFTISNGGGQINNLTDCTPAPQQSPTPTPTPTPVVQGGNTSGCVTMTTGTDYISVDCLGNNVTNTITRITATLDAIAAVDVTIRVHGTRYWCYGGTGDETIDITITAGNISNYVDVTTLAYVDCGLGTCDPESISINSYEALTNNYPLCS